MALSYLTRKKQLEELKYKDPNVTVVEDEKGNKVSNNYVIPTLSKYQQQENIRRLATNSFDEIDLIPPTITKTKATSKIKEEDDDKKWYQKFFQEADAFNDNKGNVLTDTIGTILGTTLDTGLGVVKGIAEVGEDIGNVLSGGVAQVADTFGADDYADKVRRNIANGKGHVLSNLITRGQEALDDYSILGDTGDEVGESVGQLAAYASTNGLAMFASGMGSSLEQSYQNEDAEDWQAWTRAVGSGAISVVTEKLGGFLAKGTPIDEIAANKISQKISNGMAKIFTRSTLKATAEAGEEALEYAGNQLLDLGLDKITEATSDNGVKFKEDWDWEAFGEQVAIGFLTSKAASTGLNVNSIVSTQAKNGISTKAAIKEVAKQQDRQAGMLTKSEQQALDSIVDERVKEIQKQNTLDNELKNAITSRETSQGGILSDKNKTALRESILTKIENGEIDTSSTKVNKKDLSKIQEEVKKNLSEGKYDLSKLEDILTPTETAQIKELEETLANTSDNTQKAEIQAKIKELKTSKLNSLKNMVNDNQFLNKAVYETEMSNQQYSYDETKVTDEYEKGTRESAKSYLTNTTVSRNFVDNIAKLAKDRQTNYKFTNNQELLEQGDLVENPDLTKEEKALIQDLENQLSNATTEAQKKNIQNQIDEIKYLDVGGFVRKTADGVETVLINVDSKQSLNAVVGHETKHLLEKNSLNKDYNKLLFEYAKTKGDYDTYKKRIERLYEGLDNANIENELSAALTGDYLFTDSKFIETLLNDTNSNTPKIIQKIKELIDDLVVRFKGTDQEKQLREVQKKFKELYKQSGKDINVATKETKTQFSLTDNKGRTLSKEQQNFFKDSKVRDENGNLLTMYHGTPNGNFTIFKGSNYFTSNKEYADVYQNPSASSISSGKAVNNPSTYEVYLNIKKPFDTKNDPVAREIFENEFYMKWGNGSPLMESGYPDWLEAMDLQEFIEENGYDYDGLILDEGSTGGYGQEVQSRGLSYVTFNSNQIKNVDNTNPTDSKDIRYSLSDKGTLQDSNGNDVTLETSETGTHGTLMAMHNLSAEKLKGIIDLGGFPVPSIAITNPSKVNFATYGNISVLFDKNTIDPSDKANEVYGSDVYSPRFPETVQKVNEKELDKLNKYLGKNLYVEDTTLEDTKQKNKNSIDFINKFIEENNIKVDDVYKDADDNYGFSKDENMRKFVIENDITYEKLLVNKELRNQFYDMYRDFSPMISFAERKIEIWEKTFEQGTLENGIAARLDSDFNAIKNGSEKVFDEYGTNQAKRDAVLNEYAEEYDKFLDEKLSPIFGDKYIRNSKDLFTPSGNRRSFNQLYNEYTLSNIVKVMKGKVRGEEGFFYGAGNIRSQVTPQFKSIADIKASEHKLVTNSQMESVKQDIDSDLNNLSVTAKNFGGYSYDSYETALNEIASLKRITPAKAREILNDYGFENVPDILVDKSIEFLEKLKNAPTEYFEAKPQRAVGLDEIQAIVIPNNTDTVLKQQLLDNGLNVVEYDLNIEGDRQNKINEFDNLKFSLSNQNEDIAPFGDYNVYGKDIKYYDLPFDDDVSPYRDAFEDMVKESAEGIERELGYRPQDPTKESSYDTPTSAAEWKEKAKKKTIEQKIEDTIRKHSYRNAASTSMLGRRILNFNEQERATFRDNLLGLTSKTREQLINADTYNNVRNIILQYANREFNYIDEDLVAAKRDVRNFRIKINESLKNQITDFDYFRKSNFGNLTLAKDGQGIDTIWQELNQSYPYYFSEDVTAEADMLYALSEFMQKDVMLTEKYRLTDKEIEDFTKKIYNKIIHNALSQQDLNSLEQDLTDQVERKTRQVVQNELLEEMGITDDILMNANKISQVDLMRTDPIRVNEKIFGWKNGQIINDATINATIQREAERIRFLNRERNDIKSLGIKARSKESAAVQKYGEKQYVNDFGEVVPYGDKELASEFSNVETQRKIKRAAQILRNKYDTYIDIVNNELERMGYDPILKRKDYMRHFQEMNDIFSKLGTPLNPTSLNENNLPTDINGLTDEFKPGKSWFANAQQRKGMKTVYDAITGIDGYLDSVSNVMYHTENIQRYRTLAKHIRTMFSDKALDDYDVLRDEERIEAFDKAYKGQNGYLAQYVAWLDEQANALAGKKGKLDRGFEEMFGRKAYSILNDAKKQVGSNMTGFNLRSAMTNFASAINGMSKTKKLAFVKGTLSTFNNIIKDDGLINKSNFLTTRFGSDQLSKKVWQKISNYGQIFMTGSDYFTANQIWRSKYFENLSSGMSEDMAIKNADDFAARIMGNRSKGTTAQIFNSKTLGLFTQFQLEVNNQWSSMIHDNKMEIEKGQIEGKTGKAVASVIFNLGQLAIFSNIFNTIMKSLTGSDVMFDPIDMLKDLIGSDDEEEDISTRVTKVMGDFVDDVPFANVITGGGRIPIAEAFNGLGTLTDKLTGQTNEYGNEYTWEDVWSDMFESGMYWILPTGYSQLKKSNQGLKMFDDDLPIAGSYTDSGNLRFTVDENLSNKIKAGLFGQWSSDEAQEYIDKGHTAIKQKGIEELVELDMTSSEYRDYQKALSNAKEIKDDNKYIKYLDAADNVYWYDKDNKTLYDSNYEVSDIKVTSLEKASSTEQIYDFITGLDVSDEKKEIMFNNAVNISNTDQYGNVKYTTFELNDKGKEVKKTYWYDEDNDILYNSDYEEVDSSKVDSMTRAADKIELDNYRDFSSYDEFDFAFRNAEKYQFLQENNISYQEYTSSDESKEAYNWAYNNPEQYKYAKTITEDMVLYKRFISDINDLEADKKADGKSVSGSRKKKVIAYVNSLDLSIPQKAMMIRKEYSSFDDYNKQIVEYVGSLDIAYEEKISILESLDMKVNSEGYVSW